MANTQLIGYNSDPYTVDAGSIIRVCVEPLGTDINKGMLRVLSVDHTDQHIAEADHYFIAGTNTIASGGLIVYGVETPTWDKWVHMGFEIGGTDITRIDVYEAATWGSGTGTSDIPINNNRNSSNTSVLDVRLNPTITASGTIIESYAIGQTGIGVHTSVGGAVSRADGMILASGTKYMYRMESGGADNIISYLGHWDEKEVNV